jgi:hypothetical protein
MKKFKIKITKEVVVSANSKNEALLEVSIESYTDADFQWKVTAVNGKKEVPLKTKALIKAIKDDAITAIVFSTTGSFVYQYRFNGCDCNATMHSRYNTVVEDGDDVRVELAELLRRKITRGYTHDEVITGGDIMRILSPLGVTCYLEKLSPKHYLQADDILYVEGGSDS